MFRRFGILLLAPVLLCLMLPISAQSTYNFKKVMTTGNPSPVPPLLSQILEYSFNDKGEAAYLGDGGLFFRSTRGTNVIVEPGQAAPGGGKFSYADTMALNASGRIVFRGSVSSPSTSGLFMFFRGQIDELIADGTTASNGVSLTAVSPAINAAGDVAFIDAGTNGLYLYSKGSITPLVVPGSQSPDGRTFTVISQPSINLSDAVVFLAYLSDGGSGVYLAAGGTVTKIIAANDILPGGGNFGFPSVPSINDAGQIVFGGVSNSTGGSGLFLFSNGKLSVVVPAGTTLPSGVQIDFPFVTSLNNAGQVAFVASIQSPHGTGFFLLADGKVTPAAITGQSSPDGDTFADAGEVGAVINASGQILLLSGMTQHTDTLYLFSAGQLSRVAGQGDAVGHTPRFQFPAALAIGQGNQVLLSASTFPGGTGFYLASPGQAGQNTSVVANTGESFEGGAFIYIPYASMNRKGQVALVCDTSNDFGKLVLKSGTSLTTLAGGSSGISPTGPISISSLGGVAFAGYGPTGQGLYLSENGQTNSLVPASMPAPGGGTLNYIQTNSLNRSDEVAFFAQPSAPSQNGMFLFSNGTLTPLALNGDAAPGGGTFFLPYGNPRFGPAINDTSKVAFAANITSYGTSGIFLYANHTLTRIVGPGDSAPGGGIFVSADSPAINDAGQVVFYGVTNTYLGIFLFNNGAITKVAASGDVINGQTLGYIDQPQIDDLGFVAFLSALTNGNEAIFIAEPKAAQAQEEQASDLLPSHALPPNSAIVQRLKASYQAGIEMLRRRTQHSIPSATAH